MLKSVKDGSSGLVTVIILITSPSNGSEAGKEILLDYGSEWETAW
jgi:hypothetical protein